jgi:hypothetical protein
VIPIVGVTREPDEVEETPHRHMFSVRFRVTSVSPAAIIGDVSGRTEAVISTSAVKDDQHFHLIEATRGRRGRPRCALLPLVRVQPHAL